MSEYRRRTREELLASQRRSWLSEQQRQRFEDAEARLPGRQFPESATPNRGPDPATMDTVPVGTPLPHPDGQRTGATQLRGIPSPSAPGRPVLTHSAFALGFLGTLGGLSAYLIYANVARLGTVMSILVTSVFLALALEPMVAGLMGRGLSRARSVLLVSLGLLALFAGLLAIVIPPLVREGSDLVSNAPTYVQDVTESSWWQRWDAEYHVASRITDAVNQTVNDGGFASVVFGGVLGGAAMIANWLFVFTSVLVLSLYFLSSLPTIKRTVYGLVPATKRPRFISMAEEMMSRVGLYAVGQVIVASLNAFQTWVVLTLVGMPYPAVLAVSVGLLGLVPLVGATAAGALITLVAAFTSWQLALAVFLYYLLYQQIENYLIFPKVMKHTVAVPAAVTMVAALVGGTLLGVVGALMAIPVAAAFILVYEDIVVPRQNER